MAAKILELDSFTDTDTVSTAVTAVQALIEAVKAMYPVGSLLITTTSTNPGTYLGGTWTTYAGGRVLFGADGGNFKLGATGGSLTHRHYIPIGFDTITENSTTKPRVFLLPVSATDPTPYWGSDVQERTTFLGTFGSTGAGLYRIAMTGNNTISGTNSVSDNSVASQPPFAVVYFWKRTA